MSNKVEILFLNKSIVDSLLNFPDVVDAVESVFHADGNGQLALEPVEPMPVSPQGWLLAMPAGVGSLGVAGVKWLGYFNREEGSPFPATWGNILILNHSDTGLPFAILECTSITNFRTSGGHAVVAAKHLAKKSSRVLGVLGAGPQGEAGIRSFDLAFELELIKVYARTREKTEALRDRLAPQLRARIEVVDSPEALARDTDILLTASSSKTKVIQEEWIPAGCTVTAISSFWDLDPAFSKKADKWVIGQAKTDGAHIIHAPSFAGKLDEADVYATLGDILTGKRPGRENDRERILFSHMGMGALDIAVGKKIYDLATQKGLGQTLSLT